MFYILQMTPPGSAVPEYYPKDFGFGVYAHTLDAAQAERFTNIDSARMRLHNYAYYPYAFWESERRHAEAQREKFKHWRLQVLEVTE